ncbi:MAG TPA: VTT domain-containing protein [Burkholderiales bacterium]|nr:VTT domain-containing protein [Burkholderiales bacterium]
MPILREGRNCWRIARASRAAVLIDGAAYFAAFREAARRAERSILIAGWDVDSRTDLAPQGADDGLPRGLGEFLDALVRRRRSLHAHVLGWDFAMLYALEREFLPMYSFGWRTHRRLHYHLDDRHPPGGSHHQKIAVVDDALAFVGGIDFAIGRWDTPAHAATLPGRCTPDAVPCAPFHDVQLMVEGEAAAALAELVRERWQRATGRAPRRNPPGEAPWPGGVDPDFEDVDVGIARTYPEYDGRPAVREVKQLYLDGIAAARRTVYLENQYFTSSAVTDAIAERLREDEPPEIALVSRKSCDGWLEQETMEALRGRRLRQLQDADSHGRFGAYFPEQAGLGEECIKLHSKLMIVDDRLLRIGSANLNNRSFGVDSECDLAIEAGGDAHARAIAAVRARLLGEHLDRTPDEVAQGGSLLGAIESLRGGERTLAPFDASRVPDSKLPEPELLDPERPIDAERLAQELLPPRERPHAARRLFIIAALLVVVASLAAAWRWGPLSELVRPAAIAAWAASVKAAGVAPIAVIAAYLVASLVALPITLVILSTAFVFGPVESYLYALGGSTLGAMAGFGLGHTLGRGAVRQLAGRRLNSLSRLLAKRGVLAVVTVRLLPVAPFTLVNLVAGASQLRARDFLLGTLLGMAPGIAAIVFFSDRLAAAVFEPSRANLAWFAGAAVLVVSAALVLHRWLARRTAHG